MSEKRESRPAGAEPAQEAEMKTQYQFNTTDPEVQEPGSTIGGQLINPRDWRGMARAFAENQFAGVGTPLIHYRGMFYRWIGTHYSAMEDGDIRALAYLFLDSAYTLSNESDENGEMKTVRRRFYPDDRTVNKFLDALRSIVRVSGITKAPAWLEGATDDYRANNPADILPCQNGLLNLKTWQLLPHTPTFLSVNSVGYDYDPKAKAPNWEKFIHEALPDDGSRKALRQEFGYFITNDMSQQKMFAHAGEKRSGKGTIAATLKLLIGAENVVNPTMDALAQHFGLACLIDKRLAIIGDARLKGDTSDLVSRLLTLSGEDDITIPRKNKEDWTGTLNIRFLINSNHAPAFTDDSGVIADRFILIRFLQSFFGREDPTLRDRLAKELPGILNWALDGLRDLREQGHFTQPTNSAELMEMMKFASSPILKCIEDEFEVGEEVEDSRDAVHATYKDWCLANDHKPMSKTKFDLALNRALPSVVVARPGGRGNDRARVYRGIRRRKADKQPVLTLAAHRDRGSSGAVA
jgi:putative DNA primase/helicase